jgi:hypothetical protein
MVSSRVIPVIVAYKSYPWIKVALRSFRRYFPFSPILVVDNNPDGVDDPDLRVRVGNERVWLSEWEYTDFHTIVLKRNEEPKLHGLALDYVRDWCMLHEVQYMLHFEPDCLISGCQWVQHLISAVKKGSWMAGTYRKPYGPIHPTPSIWDTGHIVASFEAHDRTEERGYSRYPELYSEDKLREAVFDGDESSWWWWENHWDTTQRAWFYMALEDRATLVTNPGDFRHFWQGSSKNTDPTKCDDSRVLDYLY